MQYNRIQSGAFENRCYAAGLRVQHGPEWQLQMWENAAKTKPGVVCMGMAWEQMVTNTKWTVTIHKPQYFCVYIMP